MRKQKSYLQSKGKINNKFLGDGEAAGISSKLFLTKENKYD
jgi:hypothetical protein